MKDNKRKAILYYKTEIYPNFFIAAFMSDKNKIINIFIMSSIANRNDLDELVKFIDDKNKIFVGYNNHHLDDIILKYLISNKPTETKSIYNIYQRLKIDEHSAVVRNIKKTKQSWYKSVDLYRLLKIETVKRFKTVQEAGINLLWRKISSHTQYQDKKLNESEMNEIINNQEKELLLYKKLYNRKKLQKTIKAIEQLEADTNLKLIYLDSGEIGNKIISHMYCKYTGIKYEQLVDMRSRHNYICIKDIIPDWISFSTIHYIELLDRLKDTIIHIYQNGNMKGKCNDAGLYQVFLTNKGHSLRISLGGLHSNNKPLIEETNTDYIIVDVDVKSYYPSIILNNRLKPAHLSNIFLSIFRKITDRRLYEKEQGNKYIAGILKTTIVSVFGKYGCPVSWFYDPKQMLAVAIIGQLGMLMLIEKLEINDVDILSVNTDGLTCKMKMKDFNLTKKIFSEWERVMKCNLEWTIYNKYILKDCINYLALTDNDRVIAKGVFNNKQYAKITKQAVINYFLYDTSVDDTIKSGKTVYDYLYYFRAKSAFYFIQNSNIIQGENRWYFSDNGSQLYKVRKKDNTRIRIENGEFAKIKNIIDADTIPSDINYQAYINHSKYLISQIENYIKQYKIDGDSSKSNIVNL
ncbi:MAG: hypothetical protein ACOCV8_00175 [Spirochaetota bacterium]